MEKEKEMFIDLSDTGFSEEELFTPTPPDCSQM